MSQALALHSRDLATELRGVLYELDPVRWGAHLEVSTREALLVLRDRLSLLVARADGLREHPNVEHLHEQLVALAHALDQYLPRSSSNAANLKQRWSEFRLTLVPHYERLANSLDAFDIHVPSLRPTNHLRSLWHAANGVVVVLAIQWVLTTQTALIAVSLSAALLAWGLELSRRYSVPMNDFLMRVFKHISHPHEEWRVNSATWYCTAMVVLALIGDPLIASIAVIVLGLADPAAALVGRRWGRVSLLNGRTLEGSLAFFGVGLAASLGLIELFHPAVSFSLAVVLSVIAALVGAIAELVCRRVDDNLAIPVAIGVVLMCTLGSISG